MRCPRCGTIAGGSVDGRGYDFKCFRCDPYGRYFKTARRNEHDSATQERAREEAWKNGLITTEQHRDKEG